MQKTKTLKIQDRELTIKELKVRDIYDLLCAADRPQDAFWDQLKMIFQRTSGLSTQDLIDLFPSEIEELWEGILEVHGSFFLLAGKIGLDQAIRGTLTKLKTDWARQYTDLSGGVTDRESGTTDMTSS